MPLLTSCGLIGLVILVLVLRIWFYLRFKKYLIIAVNYIIVRWTEVHVQAQRHKVTHRCAVSSAKSLYKPTNCARLLDYIEAGVDASTAMFPKTTIVLAGDFNSLTRRLRTCLANRSTDAWYKPSKPDIYVHDLSYVRYGGFVTSTIRSDHKAIIAYIGQPLQPLNKTRQRLVFRRRVHRHSTPFSSNTSLVSKLNIELDSDTI